MRARSWWDRHRRGAGAAAPRARPGGGGDPGLRVELTVNGRSHEFPVRPDTSLLDVLRDRLGLRGTKEACGRGECGSCTVLVGGRAVLSCLELAVRTEGEVATIEVVARDHPELCEAFADCGGYQCGFCTPGQIVRAAELLASGLPDDDRELRLLMSGNVCRCTGYAQIVASLRQAAAARTARP